MGDRLCPRTGKPVQFCCVGNPDQALKVQPKGWIDYVADGPLPQLVIYCADENGLDPHAIMDDLEDRGWEDHDEGFDEQVQVAADRVKRHGVGAE